MMETKKPNWIWTAEAEAPDECGEFLVDFTAHPGPAKLKISADSDYAVYFNGELAAFGQYPCYPSHPVFDEIELSCKEQENHLRILVYFVGSGDFSTYKLGRAGLYFSLSQGANLLRVSDETVPSRIEPHFERGHCQKITPQLGYAFFYNACAKDDQVPFCQSRKVEKPFPLEPRANLKTQLLALKNGVLKTLGEGHYLVDLGQETVGFLRMDFFASEEQNLLVVYGEHLDESGHVMQYIGNRDFGLHYRAKKGANNFLNPFRRLGCRYLEVFARSDLSIENLGIVPVVYPFQRKPYRLFNDLDQRIYDTCVYTLECCYHDHYEDCPWREQSFYVLDSRNQMLAGYDAFFNWEQVASSLRLIAQDERKDGLLSICYPSGFDLTIPSFSLNYFTAVDEYYKHTHDQALLKDVYPKLQRLIQVFIDRLEGGVIQNFTEPSQWNFYEWTPSLDYLAKEVRSDIILNSFFLLALRHLSSIALALGEEDIYLPLYRSCLPKVRADFYSSEKGYFVMAGNDPRPSILGNSLAILAGLLNPEEAKRLAEKMRHERSSFLPLSLAMEGFFYDALLQSDPQSKDFIIKDIRERYGKMLDDGATTFYETEEGWRAFDNAGSLCHGWSALPIHYYHLFALGK